MAVTTLTARINYGFHTGDRIVIDMPGLKKGWPPYKVAGRRMRPLDARLLAFELAEQYRGIYRVEIDTIRSEIFLYDPDRVLTVCAVESTTELRVYA